MFENVVLTDVQSAILVDTGELIHTAEIRPIPFVIL
jgi:hypothetical protein